MRRVASYMVARRALLPNYAHCNSVLVRSNVSVCFRQTQKRLQELRILESVVLSALLLDCETLQQTKGWTSVPSRMCSCVAQS